MMNIKNEQNVNSRIADTDVRIMSHNVFLYDKPPIADRFVYFMQELDLVAPDLFALQEASEPWHDLLTPELEKRGFAFVPLTNTNYEGAEQRLNFNPLIYHTKVFDLIGHFQIRYSTYEKDPNRARFYTCGIFEIRATKVRFAAISTHLTSNTKTEVREYARVVEAVEILDGVDWIHAEYGNIPVILTGDLNCVYGSAPLQILSRKMVYAGDCKDAVMNNTHIGTTHYKWGQLPTADHPLIDFAYLAGEGYQVKQYQHIVNTISATASDHIAIAIDLAF